MSDSRIPERDLGTGTGSPTDLVRVVKGGVSMVVPADSLPIPSAAQAELAAIKLGQSAGQLGFPTKALMDADLAHDAGTLALVTNDATAANNGTYRKTGASGSGAWVQSADRVSGLEVRASTLESTAMQYRAQIATGSLADIIVPGSYLVTPPASGFPADGPGGSGHLSVEAYGSFRWQTLRFTGASTAIWQRRGQISGGVPTFSAWSKVGFSGLVGPADLSRNFAYRALVSSGSIDTLIDEGRYLVTTATSGLPGSPPPGTGNLDVQVYGSIVWQIVRYGEQPSALWVRRATISGGVPTWGAWTEFGKTPIATAAAVGGIRVGANLSIDPSTGIMSAASGSAPLLGKTIAFIGDSVTEFGDYPALAAGRVGATALNFGFGGCRFTVHPSPNYNEMCGYKLGLAINTGNFAPLISAAQAQYELDGDDNRPQAAAMASQDWFGVDILIIGFGTNDWRNGKPIGAVGEITADGSTVAGSLNYMVQQIMTAYPHIQIGFVTPTWMIHPSMTPGQDSNNTPVDAKYMRDYIEAIFANAALRGLPAYNAHDNAGFNVYNRTLLLTDGVHPSNPGGYAQLAARVGAWIGATF